MKNLLIIGAGGCGREVLQWAKDVNDAAPQWNIKGFLDDDPDALQGKQCNVSVVSSVANYQFAEDDEFACCIGNSDVRRRITETLEAKGAKAATIIHPTAVVADTAKLGKGVILYPYSLVSDNALIGDGCIINMHSTVAHDSTLGGYCTISAHCDITGACALGEGVFMGTSSHLVPGSRIGSGAFICAGSTVMTRVRNNAKVMGNPAKPIKF